MTIILEGRGSGHSNAKNIHFRLAEVIGMSIVAMHSSLIIKKTRAIWLAQNSRRLEKRKSCFLCVLTAFAETEVCVAKVC